MVEPGLEGRQRVLWAQTTRPTMTRNVEYSEVSRLEWIGCGLCFEYLPQDVRPVGDDSIDAESHQGAHLPGIVDRPGDDAEARAVKLRYADRRSAAEQGIGLGSENGRARPMRLSVGADGGHQGEVGACRH